MQGASDRDDACDALRRHFHKTYAAALRDFIYWAYAQRLEPKLSQEFAFAHDCLLSAVFQKKSGPAGNFGRALVDLCELHQVHWAVVEDVNFAMLKELMEIAMRQVRGRQELVSAHGLVSALIAHDIWTALDRKAVAGSKARAAYARTR